MQVYVYVGDALLLAGCSPSRPPLMYMALAPGYQLHSCRYCRHPWSGMAAPASGPMGSLLPYPKKLTPRPWVRAHDERVPQLGHALRQALRPLPAAHNCPGLQGGCQQVGQVGEGGQAPALQH